MKYKYIYNIVKQSVTLNVKFRNPKISDSFKTCCLVTLTSFFNILLSLLSVDACIEFVSKDTFASQDCFSTNWLVKVWRHGFKFPNINSRGGRWDFRIGDVANFWCPVRFAGFLQFTLRV